MAQKEQDISNFKLPIALVALVLIQFGGAVWYSRGLVATLDSLSTKVIEIDDRLTIEAQVNMRRDINDILDDMENIDTNEDSINANNIKLAKLEQEVDELWVEVNAQYQEYLDLLKMVDSNH